MTIPDLEHSNLHRLADLLRIEDDAADWKGDDYSAILAHQLAAPFDEKMAQLDVSELPTLAPLDERQRGELQTLRDILMHPQPPVEHLLCLKRLGKNLARTGELPQDVAGVIYVVAIAVARLRCGAEISEMNSDALLERFRWARAQSFVDPQLRTLLDEAIAND